MNQRTYFNIITPTGDEAELYLDVYWNEDIEGAEKILKEWGVVWNDAICQPNFITREILIEKINLIYYE